MPEQPPTKRGPTPGALTLKGLAQAVEVLAERLTKVEGRLVRHASQLQHQPAMHDLGLDEPPCPR